MRRRGSGGGDGSGGGAAAALSPPAVEHQELDAAALPQKAPRPLKFGRPRADCGHPRPHLLEVVGKCGCDRLGRGQCRRHRCVAGSLAVGPSDDVIPQERLWPRGVVCIKYGTKPDVYGAYL